MSKGPTDFLSLIEQCSELELNANLNILRTDFACSDEKVSWLPLLAIQLDTYTITTFNLYEKIQMLLGIRKLVPKILKLNADLTIAVKSTENLCPNYKFNFSLNLVQNLLTHRSSCITCMYPSVNLAKPIEIEPTVCNDVIERQYLTQATSCTFPVVSVEKPIETRTRKTIRTKRKRTRFNDEIAGESISVPNEMKPIEKETRRTKIERKHSRVDSERHKQQTLSKSPTYPDLNDRKRTEKAKTRPERERKPVISKSEIDKCYPPHIVNYVRSLEESNVVSVRLNPDGQIECLLCGYQISEENYVQISHHVKGKKHLKTVRKESQSLVEFHKFWQRQTEEIWKSQFQFRYISYGLKCNLCEQHMHLKDVLPHLETCSEALAGEQPRGPYTMVTERILFRNVPFIQLGENFYPVFQRKNGNVHCMICNVVVGEDQQAHVESPEHLVLQDSERVQFSLRSYHDVWSSLAEPVQKRQTYFVRGMETMTCTICDVPIDYKLGDLTDHLGLLSHKRLLRNRKEKSRDDHMEGTTKPKFPNQAHWVLFKDAPFVKIGDDSYPTFQRHTRLPGIKYICMVCNETINTPIEKDRHTYTETHVQRLCKKTVQESLVRYHKTWNALPALTQFKQTQFERGAFQMRCTICRDTYIDYDTDALREHLKTDPHLSWNEKKSRREKKTLKGGVVDLTAGSLNKKPDENAYAPNIKIMSDSSSVIALETPDHEQDDFMVISDDEEPDMDDWGHEPVEKKLKIQGGSIAGTIKQENTPPGYIYYDYYKPDFIPSTPDVTSQFVLNPIMVKTESSCSYNEPHQLPAPSRLMVGPSSIQVNYDFGQSDRNGEDMPTTNTRPDSLVGKKKRHRHRNRLCRVVVDGQVVQVTRKIAYEMGYPSAKKEAPSTNLVDAFHQQSNGRSSTEYVHVER